MSEPTGTANILHQFTAYNKLRQDYTPEVANALTQKNLARHNVSVTPEHVEGWHVINTAAANANLDIKVERGVAEALADAAGAAILATAANQSEASATGTNETADEDFDDVEEVDEDEDEDEDPLPTLADIFGCENDEDNEEAALDDALKAQERAD